jgi:AcrR family transcriptional regulator
MANDRASALESIWARSEVPAKPARVGLSLDRVVQAALELADQEGLDAVSMARVAERLGFTTMALYRHVRSKEELLAFMLDSALTPPPSLDEPVAHWRGGLERWCRALRAGLREHPWIERVPVGGLMGTPSQLTWLDRGLGALAGTNLTEAEKAEVVLLLNGYGFWEARLVADLERAQADPAAEMSEADFGSMLSKLADPQRFPAARRAIDAGIFEDGDGDRDAAFSFGLERILDGIDRLVRRRARAQHDQ